MMASRMISQLLPPRPGSPSVYETLQQHDDSDGSDLEERAGMALDEANLGEGSDDYDLGHVESADPEGSHITTDDTALLGGRDAPLPRGDALGRSTRRPKWMAQSRHILDPEEGDDEVPLSLLTEGVDALSDPSEPRGAPSIVPPGDRALPTHLPNDSVPLQSPPRPQSRGVGIRGGRRGDFQSKLGLAMADPKERALWRWANVENLDNFLKDVYDYFLGNGIWSITLSRVLNLL
jgi:autophagy-related protein 9